ncbi:glycosyltransferase [Gluconacetobacter diazotrophicus]|uniref:glycosyltransferase n=1 Tax=Gluconacetobacter diazotrophicus TaxID=33996 RepID=UPI00119AF9B6|nr:glycosyltransferase [Gluconacetobacter diazotrophicus]TWB08374.1 GT2 family glycosyltransferase [Gluconacetobacter diazotrophicus]
MPTPPGDTVVGLLLDTACLLLSNGADAPAIERTVGAFASCLGHDAGLTITYRVDAFLLDIGTASGEQARHAVPIATMRVAPSVIEPLLALAGHASCTQDDIHAARARALRRDAAADPGHQPAWYRFDPDWYRAAYPFVAKQMVFLGCDDVVAYFRDFGIGLGHSPNPFFDEAWYRTAHPDITRLIADGVVQNGFVHYLTTGFTDRSPHWLFDSGLYRRAHPDLSPEGLAIRGYRNLYDHYLEVGDPSGLRGQWLFDPSGRFRHVAASLPHVAPTLSLSPCFDAIWYLKTYPEVAALIAAGAYSCALHHYLANPTPTRFCATPWFSEDYYRVFYEDVDSALRNGTFRTGYEHFLEFGLREWRRPHPDVDLRAFRDRLARTNPEMRLEPDPFRFWLAVPADLRIAPAPPRIDEAISRDAFRQAAEDMLLLHAHEPIDFTPDGPADLAVVMVAHNRFSLTMQALAALRTGWPGNMQVIIADSGSHDETRHLERYVAGAQIIRFARNVGYIEACNAALRMVTAPCTLYLNNDLIVEYGAIARALRRLHTAPDIGAVGAKIVRSNGILQEAGSILWRDGTTSGYLRDRDPATPEANFVREVDYCSGAFLLARTGLLHQLDGFDPAFSPAYYEEVDLCVRMRKAGYRVVYDPSVMVRHLEYGSSDTDHSRALMHRNHRVFSDRHRDTLRYCQPRAAGNAIFARSPRGARRRILYIEDRPPVRRHGAGYVRSNDIVRLMVEMDYQVTIFPILMTDSPLLDIYGALPDSVEILHDRHIGMLADLIRERPGYYDLVWVGRTHNLAQILPILAASPAALPVEGFILDTECIAAPRTAERARVLGLASPPKLDQAVRDELACAYFCQQIVAVSDHDAALVRSAGYDNVAVLGHMLEPDPTPSGWAERSGILFLGALHDMESPNYDSIAWFITQVMPRMPAEMHLTIAGHVDPSVHFSALAGQGRVTFLGAVDDPRPLYDRHRVFVAPTRFAGGLPYKVHEAAAHGLPVVASTVLCRQVGWDVGTDILCGGSDDPQCFADAIMALYEDAGLWRTVRDGAIGRIARENDPHAYRRRLADILEKLLSMG